MITRRQLLRTSAVAGLGLAGTGGYALAEPFRLRHTTYAVTPPSWTPGLGLRIAALADFHFCDPWMSIQHTRRIVAETNALRPDLVVLLGDYEPGDGMEQLSRHIPPREWAEALAGLKAPLGIHAVLGNHDWWADTAAMRRRSTPAAERALVEAGIAVHNNRAVRLEKDGRPLWIAGLADQWAFNHRRGLDDLPGTLAQIKDDAPVVLLAHEPDIFPRVPDRVSLTLCGHTHGGQVRVPGWQKRVPSRYGGRYAYGHIVEHDRHLVVSGGLGCSRMPIRFGVPPEIVIVDLGHNGPAA